MVAKVAGFWRAVGASLAAAALASCAHDGGRVGEAQEPPMPQRFLLNNDGTNLFWRDDLSMELVAQHVDECPGEVTTYLLCPNGIQTMMYPSALEAVSPHEALRRLVDAGEDPFGAFLARAKQRGFETFVTFRMNEVHCVDTPADPRLSAFWREHPEYRVERGNRPGDWMSQALDYSLAPVREYVLGLLVEIVERYDVDGIELDWMRFPRHLSGDAEEVWAKRVYLTEFVAAVREAAQAGARPLRVAVRIPTSLAGWRKLGVDVEEWNRRGLIDFITLAAFLSSDFWMPIDEVRAALSDRPVPIYACIEFGFGGWGEQRSHTERSIRSAAMGLYDCGADGVYVFNFPCWREYQADPPYHWLPQLSDPDLLKGRPLLFPLITSLHRVAGVDLPAPLPAEIAGNAARTFSLEVPATAVAPGKPPTRARLRIAPGAGLDAAWNVRSLARLEGSEGMFAVPVHVLRAGANGITLANPSPRPVQVTQIDLELDYN